MIPLSDSCCCLVASGVPQEGVLHVGKEDIERERDAEPGRLPLGGGSSRGGLEFDTTIVVAARRFPLRSRRPRRDREDGVLERRREEHEDAGLGADEGVRGCWCCFGRLPVVARRTVVLEVDEERARVVERRRGRRGHANPVRPGPGRAAVVVRAVVVALAGDVEPGLRARVRRHGDAAAVVVDEEPEAACFGGRRSLRRR
mmetsp:Transcript_11864/g.47851  ORF Transcript_11864/g.47851 Transcript_11864/m.47851 type:complete len:201 (-) Transcript_11864:970-1572(-)